MSTVTGNSRNNTLHGTGLSDWMYGLGGKDNIDGRAGDDSISGNDGNDNLIGGTGHDSLYGGAGRSIRLGVREQLLQDGCLSPSGVRLPALQGRAPLSRSALLPVIEQLVAEQPASA